MAGRIAYLGNIVTQGLVLNLDAGIKGSYPGTGDTWTDISNNGNNGTLINGPTFSSDDYGSIVFNGVNNYGNGTLTPLSGSAFTIGTWVKPLVSPSNQTYFSVGSVGATDQSIHLRLVGNTSFRFGMYSDDLNATNFSPMSGSWHYIVCTLDNSRLQAIYQNGVFKNSRTSNGMFTGNNSYYVGVWGVSSLQQYTNASIGSTHVYNRALTQTEITQNFNAYRSRYGI